MNMKHLTLSLLFSSLACTAIAEECIATVVAMMQCNSIKKKLWLANPVKSLR